MDKLELLSMANSFEVVQKDETYEVSTKYSNLGAIIYSDNDIEYFITGVYNTGSDWEEIDMKNLDKLKRFCELMLEE